MARGEHWHVWICPECGHLGSIHGGDPEAGWTCRGVEDGQACDCVITEADTLLPLCTVGGDCGSTTRSYRVPARPAFMQLMALRQLPTPSSPVGPHREPEQRER